MNQNRVPTQAASRFFRRLCPGGSSSERHETDFPGSGLNQDARLVQREQQRIGQLELVLAPEPLPGRR